MTTCRQCRSWVRAEVSQPDPVGICTFRFPPNGPDTELYGPVRYTGASQHCDLWAERS